MKKILTLLLCCLIISCNTQKDKAPHQLQETIQSVQIHKSLFFTGIIQPIQEIAVISPTDAIVESMTFQYGQIVPKNTKFMTLNAPELKKRFNESLTEYLKAKDHFRNLQSKFSGTKDLWKEGIISKNNYLSEQSGLSTARISLMQAQKKLDDILILADQKDMKTLSDLKLTDFKQIKQMLSSQHQQIYLQAPFEGMLLYPPKSLENKDERIVVGHAVKANQVIALIGDLTGLHIEIQIPETDINKVRPGMSAIIRTVTSGKHPLQGKVLAVNAQATPSQNGLPSFSALIEVKTLSKDDQERIKIGMSANIEVQDDEPDQLTVPIRAVHLRDNKTWVTILNKKHQTEERVIVTGRADPSRVTVIQGLKPGEVIVYDA